MRPILLLLAVSACAGPAPMDGAVPACSDDGRVEVGAGGSRLRALPESGGALPIVRGAQGGIHVVVGVWVRGLPLEMALTYRLEDPATGERVGELTAVALTPGLFSADGARYQRHPDLLVLNNEAPDVTRFAGRTVLLRAEARAGTVVACDERMVTLIDPG